MLALCLNKECEKKEICKRYTEEEFDNPFNFKKICEESEYLWHVEKRKETADGDNDKL